MAAGSYGGAGPADSDELHHIVSTAARTAHCLAVITAVADDAHERFADAYNLGTAIVAPSGRGTTIAAASTDTATTTDAVTIDYAGASRAVYAQPHNPTNIKGL